MSRTLQGHRTKLNKKEAPTVGSRGKTTFILCSRWLLWQWFCNVPTN